MVSMTAMLTAIKLARLGIKTYKQYKHSYTGKSKRKRNKMKELNNNWGSK